MKKINLYVCLLAMSAMGLGGCKKFLNINKDPNNPLAVPENVTVPPVEVTLGTLVVGGFPANTLAYWMQQLSLNQALPNQENYFIQPTDANNAWSFFIYPNILKNLQVMISQSEAVGHHEYVAIGYALSAYSYAITTDLWGDVPYSQALQQPAITKPVYDPQELVYAGIQKMLDSALYYIAQPASSTAPGLDDYIYSGNMAAWAKWIHLMKARYYLRLSNAPGRTAATQADSALAQVALAFGSNADNATMKYPTAEGSPWYENTDAAAGGVVIAKYFIDLLQGNNDPRLPVLATTATAGPDSATYVGRPSGTNTIYGSADDFSQVDSAYADLHAPLYMATYSEQLFIQAEATLIKQGAAAADPIYRAAIRAHMDMVGVSPADQTTYLATKPVLSTATALQQLITEKYIAGFLSLEPYNDWRRTGFPVIPLAQNALTPYIPQRWPYPTNEVLANPQPQDNVSLGTNVWWDTK